MARHIVAVLLGTAVVIVGAEIQSVSSASPLPAYQQEASAKQTVDVRTAQARLVSGAVYRFAAGF